MAKKKLLVKERNTLFNRKKDLDDLIDAGMWNSDLENEYKEIIRKLYF